MERIERIAEVLKRFAVVSLLSAVEPEGNESKESKALLCEGNQESKHCELIDKPAQEFEVDVGKEDDLSCKTPPLPSAEEVEDQNRQDSCMIEVHHGKQAKHCAEQNRCASGKNPQADFP